MIKMGKSIRHKWVNAKRFTQTWLGKLDILTQMLLVDQSDQCLPCPSATFGDIIQGSHFYRGPRWLSGRASDSGGRGPGFETHNRRKVSLSKTL